MKTKKVKVPVTWVLVADGCTAQIYVRKVTEKHIPLAVNGKHRKSSDVRVVELAPILVKPLQAESLKEYETGRNKTGMVFESYSSARHMGVPHMDARREVKLHFAQRIAELLGTAKMGKAFDRLVLVAPPAMLGEIEARITPNIKRRVVAKVAKELTHETRKGLAEHLSEHL